MRPLLVMNKATKTAIFSLGSNLGDRKTLLQKAIYMLAERLGTIEKISAVYQTPAWGFKGEDFYNCCISITTEKNPELIMDTIEAVEGQLGRERYQDNNYHSRTIDVDLLFLDDMILNTERLILPHPHIHKRKFVLEPLLDIADNFVDPILKEDIKTLIEKCEDDSKLTKTDVRLYKDPQLNYGGIRHLVIEGNIGAGKTSLAQKLSKDFNAKLIEEEFKDNPLLELFYKDPKKYAYDLEVSFLEDRYQQYHEHIHHHKEEDGLLISDYDLKKSLIFASITLDQEDYFNYKSLFELKHQQLRAADVYLYLDQPTDRLMKNIAKRGRPYEQTIKAEYLEQIASAYQDYFKSSTHPILRVDASQMDFLNSEEDYRELLKKLVSFSIRN